MPRRLDLGFELTARRRPVRISVFVDDPPRRLIIEGLSAYDVSRAASYDALVGNLSRGRVQPTTFRLLVDEEPLAGFRFLADPDAVLALIEELRAADIEVFYIQSGGRA